MSSNTVEEPLALGNIYRRKVALMQELGSLRPEKHNDHLNNDYIGYQQVMDTLRPLTRKYGIDVTPEIHPGPFAIITYTNIDDPADKIVQTFAPIDLPKDQAGSYLVKYALMKFFLIGEGDDDPDARLGDGSAPASRQQSPQPARLASVSRPADDRPKARGIPKRQGDPILVQDERCPQCGKGTIRLKDFDPANLWLGCSAYKEGCKATQTVDESPVGAEVFDIDPEDLPF